MYNKIFYSFYIFRTFRN